MSFSMCISSTSMPELMPRESRTSKRPIIAMNVNARIFISAFRSIKSAMGSMKTIMMSTATMTAMIMMMRCSARPTAVMTESIENTISMTMMVPTARGKVIFRAFGFELVSTFSSLSAIISRSSTTPL